MSDLCGGNWVGGCCGCVFTTPVDADAFQEKAVEVQTVAEVPVVAKEVVVVEEVVVHKKVGERVDTVRDTVRRTAVEVEPDPATLPPPGAARPRP